jgi:hypothetical protein
MQSILMWSIFMLSSLMLRVINAEYFYTVLHLKQFCLINVLHSRATVMILQGDKRSSLLHELVSNAEKFYRIGPE